MDDMKAKGDAAKAEGIAFAANKDQEGCIAEALVRATQQPELEFMYHAGNSVFLVSCLGAAAPVPGLCDGVPAPGEILDSVNWRIQACTARGYTDTDDQRCHRLLDGVQRHCHPDAE
jgi:hypothetical protein